MPLFYQIAANHSTTQENRSMEQPTVTVREPAVAQFGRACRQYAGNRAQNDKPQPGRLIRRPGLE